MGAMNRASIFAASAAVLGLVYCANGRNGSTPQASNGSKVTVARTTFHAAEVRVPDAALDSSPFVNQSAHPLSPIGERGPGVPDFWVRPEFKVTLAAEDLGDSRFMVFDGNGTLYLSRPGSGDIVMLRENDAGVYKITGTFVQGLSKPHGLFYKGGVVWFTSDGKVSHATASSDGKQPAQDAVNVLTGLPQEGHWWRSILVDDDGFFTSIGDNGNINDTEENGAPDREKIWRYKLDGTGKELWSSGIRNTEKLWYRPGSKRLFGFDQGSDWFGQPVGDRQGFQPITDWNPGEKFFEYVKGGFYGHPFMTGARVPRYEWVEKRRADIAQIAAKTIPPAWLGGPHWAADGWTFLDHSKMPAEFDRDAIVAFHGSWNRSTRAGYRVERIIFDKTLQTPIGNQMIVGCLDAKGGVVGRPVDVVQAPDGTLLFSVDDGRPGGRIYRIAYTGK